MYEAPHNNELQNRLSDLQSQLSLRSQEVQMLRTKLQDLQEKYSKCLDEKAEVQEKLVSHKQARISASPDNSAQLLQLKTENEDKEKALQKLQGKMAEAVLKMD